MRQARQAVKSTPCGCGCWRGTTAKGEPCPRIRPEERAAGRVADPYAVWLSEIMLQQTTVPHAAPYYAKFLFLWPTVHDLAKAPREDVMAAWRGLAITPAPVICMPARKLFRRIWRASSPAIWKGFARCRASASIRPTPSAPPPSTFPPAWSMPMWSGSSRGSSGSKRRCPLPSRKSVKQPPGWPTRTGPETMRRPSWIWVRSSVRRALHPAAPARGEAIAPRAPRAIRSAIRSRP